MPLQEVRRVLQTQLDVVDQAAQAATDEERNDLLDVLCHLQRVVDSMAELDAFKPKLAVARCNGV